MTDGRRLDYYRPQEVGRLAIQGSGQRGTEGQAMIAAAQPCWQQADWLAADLIDRLE